MSSLDAWPQLNEGERWIADALEEMFADPTMSPGEMRARAAELRAEVEQAGMPGLRPASLQLAERFDQAAAARAATR